MLKSKGGEKGSNTGNFEGRTYRFTDVLDLAVRVKKVSRKTQGFLSSNWKNGDAIYLLIEMRETGGRV